MLNFKLNTYLSNIAKVIETGNALIGNLILFVEFIDTCPVSTL